MKKSRAVAVLLLSSILMACSGGDDGGSSTDNFDTSALSGLWDATETDEDGTDVVYMDLRVSGLAIRYDYDQDDYGDGENCYNKQSFEVQSHGGGVYEYLVPGFPTRVHLSPRADTIDVRRKAGGAVVASYQRLEGISTTDLTLCV